MAPPPGLRPLPRSDGGCFGAPHPARPELEEEGDRDEGPVGACPALLGVGALRSSAVRSPIPRDSAKAQSGLMQPLLRAESPESVAQKGHGTWLFLGEGQELLIGNQRFCARLGMLGNREVKRSKPGTKGFSRFVHCSW